MLKSQSCTANPQHQGRTAIAYYLITKDKISRSKRVETKITEARSCLGALKAATRSQEQEESRDGCANPSDHGSKKQHEKNPGTRQNGK